ncbi:hypothetical protein ACKKBG_A12680 [Auxenochlorella protothecoides x Auxenochlorella symbiontica]
MATEAGGARTLIVKSVAFGVTDEQFGSYFSDIGPVSRSFLVKQGKEGPHKGYGFVQFALASDAERAVANLNGTDLGGRKLKVEVASKRATFEERKKKRQQGGDEGGAPATSAGAEAAPSDARPAKRTRQAPAARAAPGPSAAKGEKHRLVRAVAVGGAAAGDEAAVRAALGPALLRQLESVEALPAALRDDHKLTRDGCPAGPALLLVFKAVKAATQAVAALHGRRLGGGDGGAGSAPDARALWARQVSGDGLHLKRWRVVVRNLPFTVTEGALREAFSPAGFVWEVSVPRSAGGRARGFAFVGFQCHIDAERAIRTVNGTAVAGRTVAVDWALSKAQFQGEAEAAAAKAQAHVIEAAAVTLGSDDEEDAASDSDLDLEAAAPAAPLAPEAESAMQTGIIDSLLGAAASDDDNDGKDGTKDGKAPPTAAAPATDISGPTEEEDAAEPAMPDPTRPPRPATDDIFSKASLAAAAAQSRPAAPLRSAAGLLQRAAAGEAASSSSKDAGDEAAARGASAALVRTVFVRGLPLDASKEQVWTKLQLFGRLKACRLVMDRDTGKAKGTAFVEFATEEGAQTAAAAAADARESKGPAVVVAGRTVEIDMALDAQAARHASAKSQDDWRARDKRNLYLTKEGIISEGSVAWENMPEGDQAKRKRAAVERKAKLASPNFVVSSTRLSVRNIPLAWNEAKLRDVFVAAVKERASKAVPVVKQVKILKDAERPGPDGEPRSKGFGFVEFTEHEHALCALRQLNNNPTAFHKDRRPIVEFAIDNVKALKAREHRATQAQTAKAAGGPQADGPVAGEAAGPGAAREDVAAPAPEAEPKSRRQLRKERNMVARERRAAAALAKQDPNQHEKVELAEKGKRKTRAPAERPQPAPIAASVAAPRERKKGAGAAAPSAPAAQAAAVAAPEPGPEAAVQPQRKAVLRSQRRRLLRQRKAGKQGGGEHEEDAAPGAGAKKGRHGREDEAWTEPRPRRAAPPSNGVVTAGKGQTARKAGHWVGGEAGARAADRGPKAAGADLKARANPMKQKAVVAAKTVMGTKAGAATSRRASKSGMSAEKKLDSLVSEFRGKLFGKPKGKGAGEATKLGLKRWFE